MHNAFFCFICLKKGSEDTLGWKSTENPLIYPECLLFLYLQLLLASKPLE